VEPDRAPARLLRGYAVLLASRLDACYYLVDVRLVRGRWLIDYYWPAPLPSLNP